MAEDNKQVEVELDTDGVKEETIDVNTPKEPDPSFGKKEDVDLGYTDVSVKEEKKEDTKEEEDKRTYDKKIDHGHDISYENERETKLEEKPDQISQDSDRDEEGLKNYSDKVQKRIKKLTFQVKEAERREKAATEYARGLKNKYETIQTKYDETDTNYLKEYDARVDAERDKAKVALKSALESQDADKIMEANDKLTKLAVEKEKISMTLGEKEHRKKESESQTAEQKANETPPPISRRASDWATDNEWFGSDRVLTNAAMNIHEDLIQQGIDAESDEYYNQINKRMKEYFPQKFAKDTTEDHKAPIVQNVASVSRRSGGRKAVKLTKSQVVIAKKLGVPLEDYAKYVKEGT